MRVQSTPLILILLSSVWAATTSAQAYGGQSSSLPDQANGPGFYRTAPSAFGASVLSQPQSQRCALKPSQSREAEKLSDVLENRARSAWRAADRETPAAREADVARTLTRMLERISECSIVTHRAMWLAREAFARDDPSNEAFDLTLTAMDVADRGGSCECSSHAEHGATFGGPPLGDSGGGGGGVTHPPVATPQ